MYNEDLKKRFIREYTDSVNTANLCSATFSSSEKYESSLDKDLCTMSIGELQPVVDNILGVRSVSKISRMSVIKDYVKWCIDIKVDGAVNSIDKVNLTGIGKIRKQMVSSPVHLQVYLNSICEPEDEQTTDNICRCFYWMAYGGATEEEILSTKSDDVDIRNMVVHCGEHDVPIYREAVKSFINCATLTQFKYKHPNYSSDSYRSRAPGTQLIRGIRGDQTSYSIRVELSRRAKRGVEEGRTSIRLSYYKAWLSGIFYRAYELERAGINVDFIDIAEEMMAGKTYSLGRNSIEAKKKNVASSYLEDYERWKLAYSI